MRPGRIIAAIGLLLLTGCGGDKKAKSTKPSKDKTTKPAGAASDPALATRRIADVLDKVRTFSDLQKHSAELLARNIAYLDAEIAEMKRAAKLPKAALKKYFAGRSKSRRARMALRSKFMRLFARLTGNPKARAYLIGLQQKMANNRRPRQAEIRSLRQTIQKRAVELGILRAGPQAPRGRRE